MTIKENNLNDLVFLMNWNPLNKMARIEKPNPIKDVVYRPLKGSDK